MASKLISKNSNRSLGELIPYDKNQDGEVHIIQWNDNEKELDGVFNIIKSELDGEKVSPGDILVLAPRRLIGYRLRDKLSLEGIPVKSYFRESVIKNNNVRRAYSILYLSAFPEDKVSLRYLIGFGSSDYRMKQYKIILEYANTNNISIRNVLDLLVSEKIKIKGVSTIVKEYIKVLEQINRFKHKIKVDTQNAFEFFINGEQDEVDFYEIISMYQGILFNNPLPEEYDDEYFSRWLSKISNEISESIALIDSPEEIDHVRIMSLHSSKGLSAKFVILLSMIDEFMPFIPKHEFSKEELDRIIEEQRRLFYVAITRTKSSENEYPGRLIISSYIWIHGIEALKMNLSANPKKYLRVSATRFVNDFGRTAPRTILGKDL
jgi:superfamily I DNA/RNA helicase